MMEFNCVQFLQNKTILVTGATGFLAKVFVEKTLRVQPNVKKLYLVVRASDSEAAMKRLRAEVFEKDLFKVLRENIGEENLNTLLSEKVVPVAGDISTDCFGVKDSNLREHSVIVAYGKGVLKCFLVDVNSVCDMIPVDMVANAMITATATHAGGSGVHMVYHVGSSHQNPVTFGEIHEISVRYFTKSPLRSRNGSLIAVSKVRLISTMALFSLYMTLRFKLPLQLLKLIDIVYPWRSGDKYGDKNHKINMVMRLVELYEPYVLFKGIFDDRNTKSLCANQKEDETKTSKGSMFDFDPKGINWGDYLTSVHIPGLITHVLKK
ncbi:hypothetical protein F2Q68_00004699 [Brassica cretica]|uniref:Fatty acyl-CoA reductase n=1 Tax=Brassica cretica TaxID=69181 RepID=A0A8S9JKY5_BRACR|nr:hypothetical protein F2Q68_00004699 [Brassica cretica]